MAIGLITTPNPWLNGTVAPANWFQGVQDTLNGLQNATTPLLTNAISTTTPSGALTAGALYKDIIPFCGGYILSGATVGNGFNIASVSVSTSIYTVTFNTPCLSNQKIFAVACVAGTVAGIVTPSSFGTTSINFSTWNTSGVATNMSFMFAVYASS